MLAKVKALLRPLKNMLKKDTDKFLKQVSGVVHVGANTGQEREKYRKLGLDVIWVEPIPEVFQQLQANTRGFARQRAIQALVTDVNDREYEFHVASNNGASSSILDMKQHKSVWPNVEYTKSITITSTTLTRLFESENINPAQYQALIMDTQGSELLVLEGALPILQHFTFIKTEVPDFESYAGCCQLSDIIAFMAEQGYDEFDRSKFFSKAQEGNYYDVVFKKRS